ncbi:MAG: endolytic transglycosylase MltG [Bacilli bacterium]|nr:endolytic transglycosylase MltG [Bacilli bacterium]
MLVKKKPKPLLFLFLFLLIGLVSVIISYFYFTGPVNSKKKENIEVTIENGMTSVEIGNILKEKDLIHSTFFFKVYLKLTHANSLKASTYLFQKSMSLKEIVESLKEGSTYNPNQIRITFKEGLRLTDYAQAISEETNHSYEEVLALLKDSDFLQELIQKYWFLTEDILNPSIYYPLEGYLAPETYFFDDKDVEIKEIIETMLKQTEKNIEVYKEKISENPHYYFTMASVVELEGTNAENREMIVGIFQNRLSSGMNMGSDVTTYYALQLPLTSDLTSDQFNVVNPYNTRNPSMIGKMPVGPICSPGKTSLAASVNPTKSDYYYFVADKHGKIYYTKTMAEHSQKIAEIKANGDWIW